MKRIQRKSNENQINDKTKSLISVILDFNLIQLEFLAASQMEKLKCVFMDFKSVD